MKAEHERLSKIYGRISYDQRRKYMTFKIVNAKKHKANNHERGFKLDQKGRKEHLELLNEIVGDDAPNVYGGTDALASIAISQRKVIIEIVLRVYNIREHQGLRWMIQPYEQYIDSFHII